MDDDGKLLEFAGVWKAGQECHETGFYPARSDDDLECMWICACGDRTKFYEPEERKPHTIPPPTLTGDFADVVEAKIRRRLNAEGYDVAYWRAGDVSLIAESGKVLVGPTLFAAVLAYLKEREK